MANYLNYKFDLPFTLNTLINMWRWQEENWVGANLNKIIAIILYNYGPVGTNMSERQKTVKLG